MTDAIETNPFDNLSALRLDQSYADTVGVKKLLTTVRVRKPNRQDSVRVHPDSGYRLTPAAIVEVKEDREAYLVTPHMAQALAGEFCVSEAISRSQYYVMRREGWGPDEMQVGRLVRIAPEAKQRWRRERECGQAGCSRRFTQGQARFGARSGQGGVVA